LVAFLPALCTSIDFLAFFFVVGIQGVFRSMASAATTLLAPAAPAAAGGRQVLQLRDGVRIASNDVLEVRDQLIYPLNFYVVSVHVFCELRLLPCFL
jgi:hypothetical protein